MRLIVLISIFLFRFINCPAQVFDLGSGNPNNMNPINWTYSVEKQNDSIHNLIFTAAIEPGWHLYSQQEVEAGGPLPTKFTFIPSEVYTLKGVTQEPEGTALYDSVFQMKIKYFSGHATFVQPIKVVSMEKREIEAEVFFMMCDDEECRAPETTKFKIFLNGA